MIETKFKNSEVGMIPEDWEVKTLGDSFRFRYGYTDTAKENGNVRIIRITDIMSDGYLSPFDAKYINLNEENKSYLLKNKDLLMARTGATFGKTMMFSESYPAVYASFLIKVIPPADIIPDYYFYFAQSESYWQQANMLVSGGAQPQFNSNALALLQISAPSPSEQSRIATALSDIDDLISTTKKLIEKKRNIKEGAMQELLSGKRRLPGFKEKWVEKTLGEICKPYKGSQINKNDLELSTGYPVMNGGITPSGFHHEFNEPANTIIMSEGGNSCGFVSFMRTPFWAGGHCYVLRPQEPINLDYLYQVLKFCESDIMDLRTGSGLPNIKKTALNDFALKLSLNEQEQTGIATVLSDMDSEIQSLESQLTKYQSLKQGMMQQLLTGKIRLI